MSKQAANQFLQTLREDTALLEEVLGRGTGRAQRIAAMVEVATDQGLVFTESEMRDAFAEVGLIEETEELSLAELEKIGGGVDWNLDLGRIWTAMAAGRLFIGETEKNLRPRSS